jgi:hypothetical protein
MSWPIVNHDLYLPLNSDADKKIVFTADTETSIRKDRTPEREIPLGV